MKLPHSVCEVLRDHVVLESEGIDRMYLNVYVPQLQRIGGVVWYLRGHLGQRFASTAGVAPKTEAFVATINDTRDFGVGRLLKNLPELRRIGFAANRRLLEIEQISHDCALGDDAFQYLQRPRHVEGQRAPALRFGDANAQAVLNAVLMFVFVARGFTNKDLRQQFAVLLGKRADDITSGRMSYELRRLRLHGLIERLPKTHRYRLTNEGLRTALFYTRTAAGRIVEVRHRKKWPFVKHYHFHLMDPDWGHVTIRMCGYPPFGAQVILNGHEWVERQARRQHLEVVKSGNCFVEGSDFAAVNRLAARLNRAEVIGRLHDVCQRWIYTTCLNFALTLEEQERSRFAYQYSIFQLELSRNLLFQRGSTMSEVYQKLIDRTRAPLDLAQLKTIFGRSHRPHQRTTRGRDAPQVVKVVQAQSYDLTVFKVKWGNLGLKIYDKGERVLRIEVTVHNARDLRCGKVLEKLPVLLQRMNGMLVRFLDTVQAAHVSFLDQGAFERWSEPTTRGTRRLAGIDLNNARNRHVLDAVVGLSTEPDGFTLAQVVQAVRERTGWTAKKYSSRSAAYDLAKLRGKKLLHRAEHSRRYVADPGGVRTMCAYLVLRDKVIKPLLAGIVRPLGRPPKNPNPLDHHYVALRQELHRTFETIGLVP